MDQVTASPGNASPASPAAPTLALYAQIKAFITQKIQTGAWPPGHRLPSESELVALFGVARMTVNRALRELVEQGRIVRVAGVGSFVADVKPQSTLLRIAHIAVEVRARGHDYRCDCRVAERVAAAPDVAVWLDLRPGESVFHAVCLHLENDVPVQLEDRYVNPACAPNYLEVDFDSITPTQYLLEVAPLWEAQYTVMAALASPQEARWLGISGREPCLVVVRRTSNLGTPITLVRLTHPGSRYQLDGQFAP